ncbi:MAG: hypothetical protein ACE5I1_28935, partial [bacterium]
MTAYLNKYRVATRFLHSPSKCLLITFLIAISMPFQPTFAQDVVLQNTTLNTTETFTSSSAIIA